jgi:hypothetical protein
MADEKTTGNDSEMKKQRKSNEVDKTNYKNQKETTSSNQVSSNKTKRSNVWTCPGCHNVFMMQDK